MKKGLHLLLPLVLMVLFGINSYAQVTTVTGSITDESGLPVPDASISVKNGTSGTKADASGNFTLKVNKGSQLVITAVGFQPTTIIVGSQTQIGIRLKANSGQLETVVVNTGYITRKKTDLTGSSVTVDAKVLEDRPLTSVAKGLQGAAAGFQITKTSGTPGQEDLQFNIRGANSVNNVPPLVILDGMYSTTSVLEQLNPSDVASVTILEDAASAAIYGAKASGGVILITTKKGKAGPARINVDLNRSTQWIRNRPHTASMVDQLSFRSADEITRAGGDPTGSIAAKWQRMIDSAKAGVQFYSSSPSLQTYDVILSTLRPQDFAIKKFMPQQNYNISASGGSENTTYYMSVGYMDRKGMWINDKDGQSRLNGKINLNMKLGKYFTFDAKTNFYNAKWWMPGGDWGLSSKDSRYDWNMFYGLFMEDYSQWPLKDAFGNWASNSNRLVGPLMTKDFDKNNQNNLDGVFSLTMANVVKGLSIKAVLGQTYRNTTEQWFREPFQTYDPSAKLAPMPDNISNWYPAYTKNLTTEYLDDRQLVANYETTIAKKHRLSLLGVYEYNRNSYQTLGGYANNMITNIPEIWFAGSAATDKGVSASKGAEATSSYMGDIVYTYNNKYILHATVRRDESSRLAPGHRVQYFPQYSAAWIVSKEKWFSGIFPFINNFKLHASTGTLGGSLSIGYYQWSKAYNRNLNVTPIIGSSLSTTYSEGGIPSANLTWENIKQDDIGFNASFLNNKLSIDFDYYWKSNNQMVVTQNLPALLGTGAPTINDGKMKTWGWTSTINYRTTIAKDWRIDASLNVFDSKNKLVSLNNNLSIGEGQNNTIIGYPLRTIWGYVTDGYYNTKEDLTQPKVNNSNINIGDVKYIDLNGDGVINGGKGTVADHGDLKNFGTSDPRYQFGMNLNVAYKSFDFGMFIQGVAKRSFFGNTFAYSYDNNWTLKNELQMDYYTPSHTNAFYPRPWVGAWWNFMKSDKWLLNGAYARVKNIQLGYNLSDNLLKKLKMSRVRLYISGEDVLSFTKLGKFKAYYDPEFRNDGRFSYAMFSTLSFGANINF